MQRDSIDFKEYPISYQVGDAEILAQMQDLPALEPFAESVLQFSSQVAKLLMADSVAKAYPDVVTFAFWIRRTALEKLKQRFEGKKTEVVRMGRGVVFHIAPSNVPVNYAYSLMTGLLCGNANIVRLPSKEFPQTEIINRAFNQVLENWDTLRPYIALIRYGHESAVNDALSALADVRVVWGGDHTIEELRRSPLKPRATEITFSDRCSMAVIDSEKYMEESDKEQIAKAFYNDTYLTDQNACTSPSLVVWTGNRIDEAKNIFWEKLHALVEEQYAFAEIQAVDKLTACYRLAAAIPGVQKEAAEDNLIVRMHVSQASPALIDLRGNSGIFFEYNCEDICELRDYCNDTRCQTIAYIGEPEIFLPLIRSGIHGIDRIVPVGRTMDFDLLWDGYDLYERMTRGIGVEL